MTEREKLTDAERKALFWQADTKAKALRIIDAHEADRAALESQLNAMAEDCEDTQRRLGEKNAEVARLTAERDEVCERLAGEQIAREAADSLRDTFRAEVARLTAALAQERFSGKPGLSEREVLARSAAEYAQIIEELESEVARLTAERDEALQRVADLESVDERGLLGARVSDLQAEVARLTAERDEARSLAETAFANGAEQSASECNARMAEVTRLTAALAAGRQMRDMLELERRDALRRAEAAEKERDEVIRRYDKLVDFKVEKFESDVARLTAERDEARAERDHELANGPTAEEWVRERADVARLTEELATTERVLREDYNRAAKGLLAELDARRAAETEVARLTAALAAADEKAAFRQSQLDDERNENGILKEKLAAVEALCKEATDDAFETEQRALIAEQKLNHETYVSDKRAQERDAAEARVRELEADIKAERDSVREFSRKTREAESELAQLRERVAKLIRRMVEQRSHHVMIDDLEEALRGQ